MKRTHQHLDAIDYRELGINPGERLENLAFSIIPYWEPDPKYPFYYCQAEDNMLEPLTRLMYFRADYMKGYTRRDRRKFRAGYDAAFRDIVNWLKVAGFIEVDETDCEPQSDDIPW